MDTVDRGAVTVGYVIAERYEVVAHLGAGAMGTVLRVVDHELRRKELALKMLNPHLIHNPRSLTRFRNEVILARDLVHENIVRLFEFGNTARGQSFLTMEYVEGANLRSIIENNREQLNFEEVVRILLGICDGVAHAHSKGILHRDLKPDNVMISAKGEVKVADFGIARRLESEQDLTKTGESVGTIYYMAPEQIRGEPPDTRSDLYSIGIIGYELMTGVRPFVDENYFMLLQRLLNEPTPPFARGRSDIPLWFQDAIQCATAKRKNDRFATVADFARFVSKRMEEERAGRRVSYLVARTSKKLLRQCYRTSFWLSLLLLSLIPIARVSKNIGIAFSYPVLWMERETGLPLAGVTGLLLPDWGPITLDVASLRKQASFHHDERARAFRLLLSLGVRPQSDSPVSSAEAATRDDFCPSCSMIHLVTRTKGVEAIAMLARAGFAIDTPDLEGRAPLIVAIREQSESVARALIDSGAAIEVVDTDGKTALHMAIESWLRMRGLIARLLVAGANPERTDADGRSVLMYAVEHNAYEVATWLLARKASPNAPDRAGELPLTIVAAALYKSGATESERAAAQKMADLLLRGGANPFAPLADGGQAIDRFSEPDRTQLLERYEALRLNPEPILRTPLEPSELEGIHS